MTRPWKIFERSFYHRILAGTAKWYFHFCDQFICSLLMNLKCVFLASDGAWVRGSRHEHFTSMETRYHREGRGSVYTRWWWVINFHLYLDWIWKLSHLESRRMLWVQFHVRHSVAKICATINFETFYTVLFMEYLF